MNSIVGDRYIAELVQIFEQQGQFVRVCRCVRCSCGVFWTHHRAYVYSTAFSMHSMKEEILCGVQYTSSQMA